MSFSENITEVIANNYAALSKQLIEKFALHIKSHSFVKEVKITEKGISVSLEDKVKVIGSFELGGRAEKEVPVSKDNPKGIQYYLINRFQG